MSFIRAALLSTVTLLVLAIGTSYAQVPPTPPDRPFDDKVTPPGGFKPVVRPINVVSAPGPVEGLDAFVEGFLEPFVVQGPPNTILSIKSIENATIASGITAASLFELVDVPAQTKGGGTTIGPAGSGTGSSANPQPVSRANELPRDLSLTRDEQISTIVTFRKRLRYKGIPANAVQNTAGFFRSIDIELQATSQATSPRATRFTVLLGRDNGPPRIRHVGSVGNDEPDFPPFSVGVGENNNGWNRVTTNMEVVIDAEDFTVPVTSGAALDPSFVALYRVIVEYDDGARFSQSYKGLGQPQGAPAAVSRTRVVVPNIGRGGFRILLANPFGAATDVRKFTFPSNTFTTHPVASCLITGVGIDVPARAVTENSFWPPTSFQPEALPSSRACGKTYGEWESVKIDQTKAEIGIADSKLTRAPSAGSLAHNGNMPAFSCNAASLIGVRIEWTAKLKIYEGECANARVQ